MNAKLSHDQEPTDYEKQLIGIMIEEKCSFVQAMDIVFDMNGVDKRSVIDLVDFLEDRLPDLNAVEYYMNIWTGVENDMILTKDDENKPEK